jgi:hypothetical protein
MDANILMRACTLSLSLSLSLSLTALRCSCARLSSIAQVRRKICRVATKGGCNHAKDYRTNDGSSPGMNRQICTCFPRHQFACNIPTTHWQKRPWSLVFPRDGPSILCESFKSCIHLSGGNNFILKEGGGAKGSVSVRWLSLSVTWLGWRDV